MQNSDRTSTHKAMALMSRHGVNDLEGVKRALHAMRLVPDDGDKVYWARGELRSLKAYFAR